MSDVLRNRKEDNGVRQERARDRLAGWESRNHGGCVTHTQRPPKRHGFLVQTKCLSLVSPSSSLTTPLLLLTTMELGNDAKDEIEEEVQKVGRWRWSGLGLGDWRSKDKDRHLTALHPKEGGSGPAFSDSQFSIRKHSGRLFSPLEQTEFSPTSQVWLA